MSYQDINNPKLWGIMHLPTGKLLRQYPKGYGHTQLDVEDSADNIKNEGVNILPPRLFTDEGKANRALVAWLAGSWVAELQYETTDEYGSGFHYRDIPTPNKKSDRIKEHMKVVPIFLYTGYMGR